MPGNFQFRLQKLLELRRLREQQSAGRVGEAQREAEAAQAAMRTLDEVRRASAQDLALVHGSARNAGELQRTQLLLAHLDEHTSLADTRTRLLELVREQEA
jgi:flagellar biosynthesis chaperone FliJ